VPASHKAHWPQERRSDTSTRSPSENDDAASGPTSETIPATSWPKTAGGAPPHLPSMYLMSEPQIALAITRTRISRPCGGARRSLSITKGAPNSRHVAARTSIAPALPIFLFSARSISRPRRRNPGRR